MPFRRRAAPPPPPGPPPPEGPPPVETGPERDLWPWLLAFLIIVLGGLAAAYVLSRDDDEPDRGAQTVTTTDRRLTVPEPTTTSETTTERTTTVAEGKVQVPRVVGLRRDPAVERLEGAKLGSQVREVFGDRAAGIVIRQRPKPDQEVEEGTRVLLEVSKGQKPAPVPSVEGLTEQDAAARLESAGFSVIVYDVPSTEPKGRVVAQEPKPGEQAPAGSRVRINVATGSQEGQEAERKPAETVTVPDLVGMKGREAALLVRRTGLKPDPKYVPSKELFGVVVAQSPKPGKTVKRGSGVRINISKGPKPKPDVAMPNVVGKDEPTATAELEAAGFVVEVVQQDTTDPAQDGKVIEQSPVAGERVPRGETVTIVVGFLTETG